MGPPPYRPPPHPQNQSLTPCLAPPGPAWLARGAPRHGKHSLPVTESSRLTGSLQTAQKSAMWDSLALNSGICLNNMDREHLIMATLGLSRDSSAVKPKLLLWAGSGRAGGCRGAPCPSRMLHSALLPTASPHVGGGPDSEPEEEEL